MRRIDFDDLDRAERPPVVLAHAVQRVERADHRPDQLHELSGVVVLDHEHVPRAVHELPDVVLGERPQRAQLQEAHRHAGRAQPVDGLGDRAAVGAVADDREVGVGDAVHERARQLVAHRLELAHPLLHHPSAVARVLGDDADLVVLRARRQVHAARHAGDHARRDAVLGEREALVLAEGHLAVGRSARRGRSAPRRDRAAAGWPCSGRAPARSARTPAAASGRPG